MAVRCPITVGVDIRNAAATKSRLHLEGMNGTEILAVQSSIPIRIGIGNTAPADARSYFVRIIRAEVLCLCTGNHRQASDE